MVERNRQRQKQISIVKRINECVIFSAVWIRICTLFLLFVFGAFFSPVSHSFPSLRLIVTRFYRFCVRAQTLSSAHISSAILLLISLEFQNGHETHHVNNQIILSALSTKQRPRQQLRINREAKETNVSGLVTFGFSQGLLTKWNHITRLRAKKMVAYAVDEKNASKPKIFSGPCKLLIRHRYPHTQLLHVFTLWWLQKNGFSFYRRKNGIARGIKLAFHSIHTSIVFRQIFFVLLSLVCRVCWGWPLSMSFFASRFHLIFGHTTD